MNPCPPLCSCSLMVMLMQCTALHYSSSLLTASPTALSPAPSPATSLQMAGGHLCWLVGAAFHKQPMQFHRDLGRPAVVPPTTTTTTHSFLEPGPGPGHHMDGPARGAPCFAALARHLLESGGTNTTGSRDHQQPTCLGNQLLVHSSLARPDRNPQYARIKPHQRSTAMSRYLVQCHRTAALSPPLFPLCYCPPLPPPLSRPAFGSIPRSNVRSTG